jgi:hypothetical protein
MLRTILDHITGNVIVLAGNHDMPTNHAFLEANMNTLVAFSEMDRVFVVDASPVGFTLPVHGAPSSSAPMKGVHMVAVPYVPDGTLGQALQMLPGPTPASAADFVVAHQTLFPSVEEWPPAFPPCLSGHVHKRQFVGGNVVYVGSSLPVSVYDAACCRVATLDVTPGVPLDLATALHFIRLDDVTVRRTITVPDAAFLQSTHMDAEMLNGLVENGTPGTTVVVKCTPGTVGRVRASLMCSRLEGSISGVGLHFAIAGAHHRGQPARRYTVDPEGPRGSAPMMMDADDDDNEGGADAPYPTPTNTPDLPRHRPGYLTLPTGKYLRVDAAFNSFFSECLQQQLSGGGGGDTTTDGDPLTQCTRIHQRIVEALPATRSAAPSP